MPNKIVQKYAIKNITLIHNVAEKHAYYTIYNKIYWL